MRLDAEIDGLPPAFRTTPPPPPPRRRGDGDCGEDPQAMTVATARGGRHCPPRHRSRRPHRTRRLRGRRSPAGRGAGDAEVARRRRRRLARPGSRARAKCRSDSTASGLDAWRFDTAATQISAAGGDLKVADGSAQLAQAGRCLKRQRHRDAARAPCGCWKTLARHPLRDRRGRPPAARGGGPALAAARCRACRWRAQAWATRATTSAARRAPDALLAASAAGVDVGLGRADARLAVTVGARPAARDRRRRPRGRRVGRRIADRKRPWARSS